LAIYSDRIEIYNPGRFPEGRTPDDYIKGELSSIKRNPNIAQLFYYAKDIESFGTGLQRIAAACADDNVRMEFECSNIGFKVIFYRPVNHVNADSSIGDSVGVNVGDSVGVNVGVNETQQRLLVLLKESPHSTAQQLSDNLGITKRRIESNIKTLKELKLIERVGTDKKGHWVVKRGQENS
jgi:ATP-dependent DNA helicase RecG